MLKIKNMGGGTKKRIEARSKGLFAFGFSLPFWYLLNQFFGIMYLLWGNNNVSTHYYVWRINKNAYNPSTFVFPMEEEKAAELAEQVAELAEICRKMEEGLGPLHQQVREVFHRIVRSRAEVIDVVDQVSKLTAPVPH